MKKIVRLTENDLQNVINESVNNILNEISYGVVDNAYSRGDKIFYMVDSKFEDFYWALEDAEAYLKFNSEYGEQKSNPYITKIKAYADEIAKILDIKKKQNSRFYNELDKVDTKKFNDENEDDFYSEKDLRDLQNQYPQK